MNMHTCGRQSSVLVVCPPGGNCLAFLRSNLSLGTGAHQVAWVAAIKLQESSCLCLPLPRAETTGACHHARLLCKFWGSNSRVHACPASILPTVPVSQSQKTHVHTHWILTSSISSSDSASDFPGKRILMSFRTNKV